MIQLIDSFLGTFIALVLMKNVWEPLAILFGQTLYIKADEAFGDSLPDDPFKVYNGNSVIEIADYWNKRALEVVRGKNDDDDR